MPAPAPTPRLLLILHCLHHPQTTTTTTTAMNSNQTPSTASNPTTQPITTAPPQDQLENFNDGSIATPQADDDVATPPSSTDLPSTAADNSNAASPTVNIRVETDEFGNEMPPEEEAVPFLAMPDEVRSNSSPSNPSLQFATSTEEGLPSFQKEQDGADIRIDDSAEPASKKPSILHSSNSSDNFLALTLASTPTNPSSILNFSSATRNNANDNNAVGSTEEGFQDYFSSFDFESLNNIFGTPLGGNGGQAGRCLPLQPIVPEVPRTQPPVEAFPLPPYLQAQLDETYAASTLIFPHGNSTLNGADGNVFYQVTAYRHNPAAAAGYPTAYEEDKENIDPTKKARATKARPLPLRKRLLIEADYDEASTLVARKALIRHNMKEDGEKITCRCKNSKCLKLYCDCFRSGKVCRAKECGCTGCKNTVANSGPMGIRTKTITQILRRRPDAFDKRTKKSDEGCKCKKNRCLKKYCVCYNIGVHCDSRKCQCLDCCNYPGYQKEAEEEEEELYEEEEEEEVKMPAFIDVPTKTGQLLADDADSVSGESDATDEDFGIVSDKRIRHSKRMIRAKKANKPQDQESPRELGGRRKSGNNFFLALGSPSPMHHSVIQEV